MVSMARTWRNKQLFISWRDPHFLIPFPFKVSLNYLIPIPFPRKIKKIILNIF